jgi:hypothetical protein
MQTNQPAELPAQRIEVTLMNTLGRSKAAKSRKVQISFHSDNMTGSNAHPAINVKVQKLPWVGVSEDARTTAYSEITEQFWFSASVIAREHGYSGVFSEGRSDGWLVPYTQHDAAGKLVTHWTGRGPDKGYPRYPNVEDAKERRQFVTFHTAIEALLSGSIAQYVDLAGELAWEGQAV